MAVSFMTLWSLWAFLLLVLFLKSLLRIRQKWFSEWIIERCKKYKKETTI